MNKYQLRIATPDGNAYSGEAEMLALRGMEGDLAVLAGHIPFITAVRPGVCRVINGDDEREGEISGGMLCVGKDQVTLLADTFHWKESGN